MTDPHLPRSAKHDSSYPIVQGWRDRGGNEHDYDLEVLGITAGMDVRLELRDGSMHTGRVRQRSDGPRWWQPDEHDGHIVLDPGSVAIVVTDIVSIAAMPDKGFEHQSESPSSPEV